MEFIKGAMLGVAIGTIIGFNNEEKIEEAIRIGKRRYNKMMKNYPYNVF